MPVATAPKPQRQPPPANNGMTIIPLEIGGMYSAGDPSMISKGHTVLTRNQLIRPNRTDGRPPATYDNLMSIIGLSTWEDLTNQQTRFVALDATKLYMKATSGETWSAGTTTVTGTRLTGAVSYRGKLYVVLDDGTGNPTAALSWDGTNVSSTPFNSTLVSRDIAAFNDRLYLAYPRVTSTALFWGMTTFVGTTYDFTVATAWAKTNVTATNYTVSTGVIVCRLSPTSTAASACSVIGRGASAGANYGLVAGTAASSVDAKYVWRAELRGVDPLYKVPITLEWVLQTPWLPVTNYAVGDLIVPDPTLNGFRYRCTTAGQSGGGAPAFGTTVGGTTADNTVTWTCEGTDVLAAIEDYVPAITPTGTWSTWQVEGTVPAHTNQIYIGPRIKFYNTATTALTTLAPIDVSLRDGKIDTDITKQNHGQQFTAGDFRYPFVNKENSATVTLNLESLVWSEIADPKRIRGSNTYEPKDEAGLPTALRVVNQRLVMFKRRAFWIFQGTIDPDIPITAESNSIGVGCLGPRAVDVMEDEIFWIGENEIYRMRIGNYPRPLCGEAMREEIMNKAAATWVESQATYTMPLLAVDKKWREVWVYTQKGNLYCYHMADEDIPGVYRPYTPEKGMWTKHDINGQQIQAMAWNPVTGEMEFSIGGGGLVRFDPTVSPAKDQQDNTANTYNATMQITFKDIEQLGPAGERYDVTLHDIGLYHTATAAQAGQTLTADISFDRGTTWPKTIQVQFDPTIPRIPIPIYQTGPQIRVRLSYVGKAGAAAWSISRADARIQIRRRPEYPQTFPTINSATL